MTTDNDAPRDPYPNAGRDSGYVDEAGQPVGENIINRVTTLTTENQVKLNLLTSRVDVTIGKVDATADRLDATITHQDTRFTYLLGQMQRLIETESTSRDVIVAEMRTNATEMASAAADMRAFTLQVKKNWQDIVLWQAEKDAEIAAIGDRMTAIEQLPQVRDARLLQEIVDKVTWATRAIWLLFIPFACLALLLLLATILRGAR
jgi:hypothetical protein